MIALRELAVPERNIFIDKQSGKDFERPQYKKLLRLDGIELDFEQEALEAIADRAVSRGTGARGLRSIIESVMGEIMYDAPSDPTIVKITVTRECVDGSEPPIMVRDPALQDGGQRRILPPRRNTAS